MFENVSFQRDSHRLCNDRYPSFDEHYQRSIVHRFYPRIIVQWIEFFDATRDTREQCKKCVEIDSQRSKIQPGRNMRALKRKFVLCRQQEATIPEVLADLVNNRRIVIDEFNSNVPRTTQVLSTLNDKTRDKVSSSITVYIKYISRCPIAAATARNSKLVTSDFVLRASLFPSFYLTAQRDV